MSRSGRRDKRQDQIHIHSCGNRQIRKLSTGPLELRHRANGGSSPGCQGCSGCQIRQGFLGSSSVCGICIPTMQTSRACTALPDVEAGQRYLGTCWYWCIVQWRECPLQCQCRSVSGLPRLQVHLLGFEGRTLNAKSTWKTWKTCNLTRLSRCLWRFLHPLPFCSCTRLTFLTDRAGLLGADRPPESGLGLACDLIGLSARLQHENCCGLVWVHLHSLQSSTMQVEVRVHSGFFFLFPERAVRCTQEATAERDGVHGGVAWHCCQR